MKRYLRPLRRQLRYWFDDYMGRGFWSTLKALMISFLVLFVVISLLRGLVERRRGGEIEQGGGFFRQVWLTWLEMTDPGTQAYEIGSSWTYKAFAVIAALFGIAVMSGVIAVMTTALDERLRKLRAGHSSVIENDHTLILGWNSRIVEILHELIEANDSEANPSVVILANKDKEEMDEFLRVQIPPRKRGDTNRTKIVTRNGLASAPGDLRIVAPTEAKSIIVLLPEHDGGDSPTDITVLKTVMAALLATPDNTVPIVAEMTNDENKAITANLDPERVTVVDAESTLAKIMVQCSRTEGLATVYNEVLSFRGAELYLTDEHNAAGVPFGSVGYHFADGVPLGLRRADEIMIRPDPDFALADGDELILLAEDDSAIAWSETPVCTPTAGTIPDHRGQRTIEHELMIGWTPKSATIIREYADYLEAGSTIDVVTRNPDHDIADAVAALDAELDCIAVRLTETNPHSGSSLGELALHHYDNVLLLSQASPSGMIAEHTDTETLTILLRIREAMHGRAMVSAGFAAAPELGGGPAGRLVSEVLDAHNEELLMQAGVKDVLISNRLVSSIIAQLSEEPTVQEIYDSLFAEEGSEIYLKPAEWYFPELPLQVSFCDIMDRARQREEQALGYRSVRAEFNSSDANYGVRLNPAKDQAITLEPGDTIVVLAEDEL
ncbi:MAG: hypothetical protein HKN26_12425 [Acidimicrobiales bacterium]|nr:hypothetical protein [Acidimicrobiales bacterium]